MTASSLQSVRSLCSSRYSPFRVRSLSMTDSPERTYIVPSTLHSYDGTIPRSLTTSALTMTTMDCIRGSNSDTYLSTMPEVRRGMSEGQTVTNSPPRTENDSLMSIMKSSPDVRMVSTPLSFR